MTSGDTHPTPVRLSAGDPGRDALVTGKAVLVIGGEPVDFELTVPSGPVAVEDVLPVIHGLSSLFAGRAAALAQAQGKTISCRAGCGACCRQLVPVAAAEARAIANLVKAMPEPRQAHVRKRFEDAIAALSESDVLDRMSEPTERRLELGVDYFRQGVACPFLEDEACSIHHDRPLSCREYLVTSSPEHCRSLESGFIEKAPLEGDPSLALLHADLRGGWMPLVLSLVFDGQAPPSARDRTAPDILADVFGRL